MEFQRWRLERKDGNLILLQIQGLANTDPKIGYILKPGKLNCGLPVNILKSAMASLLETIALLKRLNTIYNLMIVLLTVLSCIHNLSKYIPFGKSLILIWSDNPPLRFVPVFCNTVWPLKLTRFSL